MILEAYSWLWTVLYWLVVLIWILIKVAFLAILLPTEYLIWSLLTLIKLGCCFLDQFCMQCINSFTSATMIYSIGLWLLLNHSWILYFIFQGYSWWHASFASNGTNMMPRVCSLSLGIELWTIQSSTFTDMPWLWPLPGISVFTRVL